ncbi:maleylpyruvate isomerase N-terminal domain-containing protein [Brevibacterium sandarakinum]|uniref:maleylpyruvate isomerase N-terminal domain-containing protein n=1 Tax=Brevibacterium sandarakinum TaxID=629680 RepID=UPI0038B3D080
MIHAERSRLAEHLGGLDGVRWNEPTLCADWSVEQVVAHLSAAANTGRWAWIRKSSATLFQPRSHQRRTIRPSSARSSSTARTLLALWGWIWIPTPKRFSRWRASLRRRTSPSTAEPWSRG